MSKFELIAGVSKLINFQAHSTFGEWTRRKWRFLASQSLQAQKMTHLILWSTMVVISAKFSWMILLNQISFSNKLKFRLGWLRHWGNAHLHFRRPQAGKKKIPASSNFLLAQIWQQKIDQRQGYISYIVKSWLISGLGVKQNKPTHRQIPLG